MDKNIYITPIPGGPGRTFYFPGCHVYLHLDKHLTMLQVPKGNISLDMLFSARNDASGRDLEGRCPERGV